MSADNLTNEWPFFNSIEWHLCMWMVLFLFCMWQKSRQDLLKNLESKSKQNNDNTINNNSNTNHLTAKATIKLHVLYFCYGILRPHGKIFNAFALMIETKSERVKIDQFLESTHQCSTIIWVNETRSLSTLIIPWNIQMLFYVWIKQAQIFATDFHVG